ncbi:hypothetical protein [Streptomyces sp. 8N616]|uniref:hypothetical protein n=1 Tax=Streptomyces sp. 8N616 TaxID=3457414 RepID=UPI003FCFE309
MTERFRNGRTGAAVALSAAAVLFVFVSGCTGTGGQDGSPAPSPSPATPSSPTSSPADQQRTPPPSSSPSASASEDRKVPAPVLVEMVVSGGFAGRQEQIRVLDDGTYTTLDKGRNGPKSTLRPTQLRSLREALKSADFERLPRRTVDENARDMITYVVVHDHVTVMTDQSTPVRPLDEVINMLSGLLPGHAAR